MISTGTIEAASVDGKNSRRKYVKIKVALFFVIAVVFFGALSARSHGGPDFDRYLEWAGVAASGDIYRLGSEIGSPLGIPVSQWSFGPGFVFGAVSYLTGLSPHAGAMLAGSVAAVALWSTLTVILRRIAPNDGSAVALGLVAAFLGTHLGYYSHIHASESLSIATAAFLGFLLLKREIPDLLEALGVGAVIALIIVLRPQLLLYGAVGAGAVLWRVRRSRGELIKVALAMALPIMVALGETAVVNRWMTGLPWHSPYSFGNGDFRSVDFFHPQIYAVLLHPWHGLLIYHPLYAVGFGALLQGVFCRSRSRGARLFDAGLAIAIIANLYLQASWYCWWLGTGTFGMRGLAVAGVAVIPSLVRVMHELGEVGRRRLLVAIALCCVYSSTLLWQGESNFTSYHMFASALMKTLLSPQFAAPLATAIVLAGLIAFRARGRHQVVAAAVASGLFGLVGAYLFRIPAQRFLPSMLSPDAAAALETASPFIACIVTALAASAAAWLLLDSSWIDCANEILSRRLPAALGRRLAAGLGIIAFGLVSALFIRAMIVTESTVASGKQTRAFQRSATVDLKEIAACYQEYLKVEGFLAEKERLRRYLAFHEMR